MYGHWKTNSKTYYHQNYIYNSQSELVYYGNVQGQTIWSSTHPKLGFKYYHNTKIVSEKSDFFVVIDERTRKPISFGNKLFSLSADGVVLFNFGPLMSHGYDGKNYILTAKLPYSKNQNYGVRVSLNADMTNKFVVSVAAMLILRKQIPAQQTVPQTR